MATLKQIEVAEQRMNVARLALLDQIDQPNRDLPLYRTIVRELSDSIEQYVALNRERLKKS